MFVELIVEKVLGIDNAFEEYDESGETSSQNFELSKDIKLYCQCGTQQTFITQLSLHISPLLFKEQFLPEFTREIQLPPPRV